MAFSDSSYHNSLEHGQNLPFRPFRVKVLSIFAKSLNIAKSIFRPELSIIFKMALCEVIKSVEYSKLRSWSI